MYITIRTKIFLTLFIVSLIFVLTYIFIINIFLADIARDEITNNLQSGKFAYERFTQLRYDLLISKARSISQTPHLKAVMNISDVDHKTAYFTARELYGVNDVDLMLLIDVDGMLLVDAADSSFFNYDMRTFQGITDGLNGLEYYGTQQYRENLYQIVLTPILLENQLLGLLVLGDRFDSSVNKIREFTGRDVLVLYSRKLVSQSWDTSESPIIEQAEIVSFMNNLANIQVSNDTSISPYVSILGGKECLAIAIPFGNEEGYTVLFRSLEEVGSGVKVLRFFVLGEGIVAIFLAVFYGIWLSKKVSKPILKLRDAAKQFGAGRLESPVEVHSNDELGQLSEAFNAMVKDIHAAREALESERDYVNSILNSMIDMLIVLNPDGTIRAVNPAAVDSLRYMEEELLGRSFRKFIDSAEKETGREPFEDIWDRLIRNGLIRNVEMVFLSKDHREIPVILSCSVINDVKKKIQGVVCVAQDVSEWKEAEEKIRESENLLNDFFEESQIGLHIFGPDGIITHINRAELDMIGYSRGEIIGEKRWADLIVPEQLPRFEDHWRRINDNETSGVSNLEYTLIHKNGLHVDVLLSASGRYDSHGKLINTRGSVLDITERKKAEDDLKNSQKQLQALSSHLQILQEEERTRISREIHDELGQSLTGIKMDLVWLKDEMSTHQKPLIDDLIKFIDTTMKIVQRISTQLRPVILDDLGLIAAIEWQIQDFQTRSGINCELYFETEDISIDQDRSTATFRILQEALTNIYRHAEANKVTVNLEQKGKNLLMSVIDDGKGISNEQITNRNSLGILGMKERLQPWGGEFKISKMTDSGTKLTIRLPLDT